MGQSGCANCIVFAPCGGHPQPLIYQVGCANYAGSKRPKDTDDMNPHFEDTFWELWNDVGGLLDYSVNRLTTITANGLPRYVPMLQGRHLHPSQPFNLRAVALPLFHVVGRRKDGCYGPKFPSASALRAAYKLQRDTRVLLIGVDEDAPLETFWQKHRRANACQSIAKLGLEVTTPNFSFFICAPRFQILRNRKRILLTAERLSQAGVRVSPHLNANTPGDWAFWLDFLQQHPEVTTVTMEFQTGARLKKAVGDDAFRQLVKTIQRLERPVHCLLIGAGRYYKAATEQLPAFTEIDSVPFMQATKRRMLTKSVSGRYSLKKVPTHERASLQALFEASLKHYEGMLSKGPAKPRTLPPPDSKQPEFLC